MSDDDHARGSGAQGTGKRGADAGAGNPPRPDADAADLRRAAVAPPGPGSAVPDSAGRAITRWLLAALYLAAGVLHLARPAPFLKITPGWVPDPALVIALTGCAELAGAAGLVQPWSLPLRRAAAVGLAAYAVCVFPANINHFMLDMARPDHGLGLAYHVPRMFAQPLLIWAALWSGRVWNGRVWSGRSIARG